MFPLIFIIIYLHSHAWPIQSSPSLDCSFRGKGGTYNDPSWDLNWECSCFEVIVLTTILSYFIPLCLCQDIFPQGTSDLFFSWWLICSYPVSVFRDSPWTPDSWCWDRRESGVHWMFVTAVLYKIPADTAALRSPKTVLFLDLTHSGASEIRHNRYGSNLTQNSFVEQFQHLCNNIKLKKKVPLCLGQDDFYCCQISNKHCQDTSLRNHPKLGMFLCDTTTNLYENIKLYERWRHTWIIMELLALFVHLYCYLTNYLKLSQLYSLCQVI